jgi:hypothetical protein
VQAVEPRPFFRQAVFGGGYHASLERSVFGGVGGDLRLNIFTGGLQFIGVHFINGFGGILSFH